MPIAQRAIYCAVLDLEIASLKVVWLKPLSISFGGSYRIICALAHANQRARKSQLSEPYFRINKGALLALK